MVYYKNDLKQKICITYHIAVSKHISTGNLYHNMCSVNIIVHEICITYKILYQNITVHEICITYKILYQNIIVQEIRITYTVSKQSRNFITLNCITRSSTNIQYIHYTRVAIIQLSNALSHKSINPT